jgi:hypothetical protein
LGCCSLKKDPAGTSWPSLVAVCAPLAVLGGASFLVLALAAAVVRPLQGPRDSLRCLLLRNAAVVNARFRHTAWRCTVAGVLLRRWPAASGMAFRHLYPASLAAAWTLATAALVGLALGVT